MICVIRARLTHPAGYSESSPSRSTTVSRSRVRSTASTSRPRSWGSARTMAYIRPAIARRSSSQRGPSESSLAVAAPTGVRDALPHSGQRDDAFVPERS